MRTVPDRPPYRPHWEWLYARNRDGYVKMLAWDPFENWEQNRAPESSAYQELLSVLDISYGRGDQEVARRYLERCLAVCRRALEEDKAQSPLCREHFPENRGVLVRTQAYAAAIAGRTLDHTALLAASADLSAVNSGYPKRKWRHIEEAVYLSAVRPALIGGGRTEARELLDGHRFRTHAEEVALLRELVATPPDDLRRDEGFRSRFDDFFDRVRAPGYNPDEYSNVDLLQLELGLLRDKFLVSPDGSIDWQRAIDAVAE